MAEGERWSRSRDDELTEHIETLSGDLRTISRFRKWFPDVVAYDDLAEVVAADLRKTDAALAALRALPVPLDPRGRPDLVGYLGRRYNVTLGGRRPAMLRNVELTYGSDSYFRRLLWRYPGGAHRDAFGADIAAVEEIES